jgi:hypothetical protein
VSNVYTTLSQANDKLAALQSMGATAASQINEGALSHGTGAILEVALISSAIWQGALSYTTDQGENVFNIDKAIAAARLTYGRYAEVYGHGDGSSFATKGATSLAGWRARVLAMLHPFTWNKEVYDWRLSLEQAVKETMKLSADKSPAKVAQMEKDVRWRSKLPTLGLTRCACSTLSRLTVSCILTLSNCGATCSPRS